MLGDVNWSSSFSTVLDEQLHENGLASDHSQSVDWFDLTTTLEEELGRYPAEEQFGADEAAGTDEVDFGAPFTLRAIGL